MIEWNGANVGDIFALWAQAPKTFAMRYGITTKQIHIRLKVGSNKDRVTEEDFILIPVGSMVGVEDQKIVFR